jgi:hypothetical protein
MISKILNNLKTNKNKIIHSGNKKNPLGFFQTKFHSLKANNFFTKDLKKKEIEKINKNLAINYNFSSKIEINENSNSALNNFSSKIEINENSNSALNNFSLDLQNFDDLEKCKIILFYLLKDKGIFYFINLILI